MIYSAAYAVPGDAAVLAKLHAEALPPGWPATDFAAYCQSVNRIALKANLADSIAGLAVLQVAAGEAEVLTIAVSEKCRRQGIATCLLKAALGICRKKSAHRIYLEVAEGNRPAQELYKRFGFHAIATRKNYYRTVLSKPESALIMRLNIEQAFSPVDLDRGSI